MKIGILASHRGQNQYKDQYNAVIQFLEKKGHTLVHSMDTSLDSLILLNYVERERKFYDFFQELEQCDVVIGECSIQSTYVGFGLAYLRQKGKPIIIISQKGSGGQYATKGEVYSEMENMMVTEYEPFNMLSIIDDAISFMQERLDKRFTMIFPANLMAKLESMSKKKRLPKAVYIRQLLEDRLATEIE